MLRVLRNPDGTWDASRQGAGITPHWRDGPTHVESIDQFESEVADRLAILLLLDPGARLDNVGRRIGDDVFWLFYEPDEEEED